MVLFGDSLLEHLTGPCKEFRQQDEMRDFESELKTLE
jgi:hypothetical protein